MHNGINRETAIMCVIQKIKEKHKELNNRCIDKEMQLLFERARKIFESPEPISLDQVFSPLTVSVEETKEGIIISN